MRRRHVLIGLDGPVPAFKSGTPFPKNLEIYTPTLKPPADNLDVQIDLALLSDLKTPMDLVFVGGGTAGKQLAAEYKAHYVPTLDDLDPTVWKD